MWASPEAVATRSRPHNWRGLEHNQHSVHVRVELELIRLCDGLDHIARVFERWVTGIHVSDQIVLLHRSTKDIFARHEISDNATKANIDTRGVEEDESIFIGSGRISLLAIIFRIGIFTSSLTA